MTVLFFFIICFLVDVTIFFFWRKMYVAVTFPYFSLFFFGQITQFPEAL